MRFLLLFRACPGRFLAFLLERGRERRCVKVLTKRNRLEQKFAVLVACMLHLNCTHLMYQTQGNNAVLNSLVDELLEKGLLVEKVVRKRSFFKTSAKGYELLKEWRQLEAVVGA